MLYRCKNKVCNKRRKLTKPLEQYKREPRCHGCKGELRYDKWQTEKNKKHTCRCGGWPYEHRIKSVIGCIHYDGVVDCEEYKDAINNLAR